MFLGLTIEGQNAFVQLLLEFLDSEVEGTFKCSGMTHVFLNEGYGTMAMRDLLTSFSSSWSLCFRGLVDITLSGAV